MTKAEYFLNVLKNKLDDNFSEISTVLDGLKEGETAVFKLDMSVEFFGGSLVPSGGFMSQKKMKVTKDPIDQEPFDPDQPDMLETETAAQLTAKRLNIVGKQAKK